ncbi:MAG TPA: vWA domain-containing protein [Polyangia bacterium]|nr:vWA domain-containing protein [Polyangia bacterium]
MKCSAFAVLTLALACSNPAITASGDNASGGGKSGGGGKGMAPGSVRDTPPGSGGSGGTGAGPNPDDKNCGLQTFKLQQRPAELMLVLDRSGSMNDPAGPMSTVSKWTDVTGALDETIMKTQSLVQWGLKSFPSSDMRCMVSDGVEVPSAAMNYAPVWARIQAVAPGIGAGGGTPTTLAVQKTVAYLDATPSMNPRYLVLATDGEPNCAAGGGGRNGGFGANDDAAAIKAVADAVTAGYKTFVIGIATSGLADQVLSQMATAGGEPRMANPPYYPVANRQDLIDALGVITGLVTDCVFRLNMPPPSPNDTAVNVGTTRVPRDPSHMNGWDYGAANKSIQFYGPACEAVKKAAGENVQIIFGCPGVVIP